MSCCGIYSRSFLWLVLLWYSTGTNLWFVDRFSRTRLLFCFQTSTHTQGPEFIFHHVFSLAVAWGALFPGTAHMYTIFFFGLSEISTAVLCVLANFDDDHGVPGLGEALPLTKVTCGAAFVVLFILCRCILWPLTSYYFCRDLYHALRSNDPRAVYRRGWMRFFYVALAGMTILQVAWLGQILVLGRQELQKAGLIE